MLPRLSKSPALQFREVNSTYSCISISQSHFGDVIIHDARHGWHNKAIMTTTITSLKLTGTLYVSGLELSLAIIVSYHPIYTINIAETFSISWSAFMFGMLNYHVIKMESV